MACANGRAKQSNLIAAGRTVITCRRSPESEAVEGLENLHDQ
jgi:hypothetical protein